MAYLDAFRGLSMVLVVFGHVLFHSLQLHQEHSVLNMILQSFRMPSFFFISGFVAYRVLERWNASYTGDILLRKFQAQVVGTAFFTVVLWLAFPRDHIFKPLYINFGAYWFTITLFRIFLIYTIVVWLCKWLTALICRKGRNAWFDGNLLMVCVFVGLSCLFLGVAEAKSLPEVAAEIVSYRTLIYFQYFTAGVIMRMIGGKALRIFNNGNTIGVLFVVFMLLSILLHVHGKTIAEFSDTALTLLKRELLSYVGILTVFGIFYHISDSFERVEGIGGATARSLRYIGRRTLDIYFLHYFFLPNLHWMHTMFPDRGNTMVTQIVVGGVVTIVVVACCLGVSYVMRRSVWLRSWLFGVKVIRDKRS